MLKLIKMWIWDVDMLADLVYSYSSISKFESTINLSFSFRILGDSIRHGSPACGSTIYIGIPRIQVVKPKKWSTESSAL